MKPADATAGGPIPECDRRCARRSLGGSVRLTLVAVGLVVAWPALTPAATDSPEVTRALRERAVAVLRGVLADGQGWTKVRAAEYLLGLDYREGVEEIFQEQLASAGDEPETRIGIWRVLAGAAGREEERDVWMAKIRDVFLDVNASDRFPAGGTLGQLGYRISDEEADAFERAARAAEGRMAAFAHWVLVHSDREISEARLLELLESDDPATRAAAAHALRHLSGISPTTRAKLADVVLRRAEDSGSVGIYLACAAAVHGSDEARASWRDLLRRYAEAGVPVQKYHACETLAVIGGREDLPLLTRLLEDPEANVRAAAAYAILRIGRRVPHHMPPLDWLVIAIYAGAMLGIGWHYARRTKTTDDYLLGGRKMKPLGVGLSLFATLLSTITYLALPGEMIRYGPMILAVTCAFPLIYLVAGWFMIPFIMKLKITSAYEILEARLGLGVRMLGSTFFLAMRLLWMAVIIFATTDKVLVPLLGLDSSATPYLCAVLGLITVTYTSMGGLRAVVLTDVIQTLILFLGAIVTIVLITSQLKGVGGWWPSGWQAHWPEPVWGYSSTARITFFGAMIAQFTWWVCTAGSDQMAVQRYLATRDAKAARRVLATSLAANAVVNVLLCAAGLALLAYFRKNPHVIPDGQTILSDSDTLFPRFIAFSLPVGLSGLVVAGLLAAAMSSLSSGVNSSCSVITVDFIDRFRKDKQSKTDHVKLAKYVSVAVGVVVVLLTSGVGMVQGNLLAVAYKVVNLLTAPLFGLFFMAMFVRFATGLGTLVGAAFGLAVVVLVSYWEEITGTQGISFIWAMPLSFVVQTGVGMLASLIPIGRRRRPAHGSRLAAISKEPG